MKKGGLNCSHLSSFKRPSSISRSTTIAYEEAATAAQDIGYPVILKPTNASSSQNVFFISNSSELKKAMREMLDFHVTYMDFKVRKEYLIEEDMDGQEFSVEIFLVDGKVLFSAVTEKTTSPLPYFVEVVHTLPTSVCSEEEEAIINTAVNAVKAIGITSGPSHVEVKLTKEGPKIVEVRAKELALKAINNIKIIYKDNS